MSITNRIVLIGHLGTNPDVKTTQTGKTVTTLHLATNSNFKNKNESVFPTPYQTKTVWHRISVWGKLAEAAGQNLKKGDKVFIEGSLNKRSYEDTDGKTHYIHEVKAYFVEQVQPLFFNTNSYQQDDLPEEFDSDEDSESLMDVAG